MGRHLPKANSSTARDPIQEGYGIEKMNQIDPMACSILTCSSYSKFCRACGLRICRLCQTFNAGGHGAVGATMPSPNTRESAVIGLEYKAYKPRK